MIPDAISVTGIRSGTGAAIVVDGEFWGVMGAGVAEGKPLPDHIEDRLSEFTELVATAIANAQARSDLAASRARSWRRPTRSAGGWFAICTTARSSA